MQSNFINSTGYATVKTDDGRLVKEHREIYKREIGPIPDGWHIHHRDEDKLNNRPDNLEALPWPEHKRRHVKHWRDVSGRWWKRCTSCGVAQPEEQFPTKQYVNGIRKTRGNCLDCDTARIRKTTGYQGKFEKTLGKRFGPRKSGTT